MKQNYFDRVKAKFKQLFTFNFYLEILSGKRKIRLFLLIFSYAFIITLTTVIKSYFPLYQHVRNLGNSVEEVIHGLVPEDLEIKIKNGIVSTNVTEPYYVTIDGNLFQKVLGGVEKNNTVSKTRILAIDTKGKIDDFEQYQSLALLTQSNLVSYNNSKISVTPLRGIQELIVSRKTILDTFHQADKKYHIIQLITSFIYLAPIIILVSIFLFSFLLYGYLAMLVYIMVRVMQLQLKFGSVYKYTFAISIVPIVIWEILGNIPITAHYTVYLDAVHTMFILALCYIGLKKYSSKKY